MNSELRVYIDDGGGLGFWMNGADIEPSGCGSTWSRSASGTCSSELSPNDDNGHWWLSVGTVRTVVREIACEVDKGTSAAVLLVNGERLPVHLSALDIRRGELSAVFELQDVALTWKRSRRAVKAALFG